MKTTINIFVMLMLAIASCINVSAQTPTSPKVTVIRLPAGSNTGQMTGNISTGKKIELGWAEKSNVACFPGTRFEMFNGNHVFYRIQMPAASRLTVTVTPKSGTGINLYALRQGATETAAPPNISSAISCEAKYPIYANKVGGGRVKNADDGKRKIEYISVNAPYSILIGVAGAEGLMEGDFTLAVELQGR